MIAPVAKRKVRYGLKIAVVSDDGRERHRYRIRAFKPEGPVDSLRSPCLGYPRKPDVSIVRLAPEIAQAPAQQGVDSEHTPMSFQIA